MGFLSNLFNSNVPASDPPTIQEEEETAEMIYELVPDIAEKGLYYAVPKGQVVEPEEPGWFSKLFG